jgi:hypothetical protein
VAIELDGLLVAIEPVRMRSTSSADLHDGTRRGSLRSPSSQIFASNSSRAFAIDLVRRSTNRTRPQMFEIELVVDPRSNSSQVFAE